MNMDKSDDDDDDDDDAAAAAAAIGADLPGVGGALLVGAPVAAGADE